MRIYDCGFDQATSLEFGGYVGAGATPTFSYPTPGLKGITGTRSFKTQGNGFSGGQHSNWHNFGNKTEVFFRFRGKWTDGGGATVNIGFQLEDSAGNNIFKLDGDYSGTLAATIGDATSGGSATGTLVSGVTALVEGRVKIDSGAGEIEIKFDGVTVYTFSGDTDPNSRVNAYRLRILGGGRDDTYETDDVSVNDISGVVDNSWLGPGYLLYLAPNGNGDSSDMVGSDGNSTDNYLLVDDVPNDGDATFVSAAASGDKDNYALASLPTLPAGATIRFVQPVAIAKRFTTASDIDVGIKSDTTEDFAASQALTTSYAMYRGERYYVDPDDSAAWDETKVNALTASVRAG